MREIPDELRTLIERRDYLAQRITAKLSVGWEIAYDEREHDALSWAIRKLRWPEVTDGA